LIELKKKFYLMKKRNKKFDKFHYHEALDRAFIVANMVDEYLMEHPVVQKHKELKKKVKKAETLLYDVYQLIGRLDFKLFPDKQKSDKH